MRALPWILRVEIVSLAVLVVVLLATYGATPYFVSDPADPSANLVTRASRMIAGLLVLGTLALALLAPRLSVRGGDHAGLAALPLPPTAVAGFRADRLAFVALPILILGLGALLPPAGWHEGAVSACAIAAWIAWLWAASQIAAALDALCLEGRWGPGVGGVLARVVGLLAVPLVFFLYRAARESTESLVDLHRASSLLVTAGLGLGLAAVSRLAATIAGASAAAAERRLAEQLWVRRWRKRIAVKRSRRAPALVRGPGSALAWKDALVAARKPAVRSQWLLAALLLWLPLLVVLRPGVPPPWVFAGLVQVLGAAAAGAAVLLLWYHELPVCAFGTPVSRRMQWAAKALPLLAVVLGAAVALTIVAWILASAHTARVLLLWTGVSGASLVLAAANLGQASPPTSPLGQNLYGLGLFCCVLVGSVYPGIGWLALAGFALYTLHSLARDPRA